MKMFPLSAPPKPPNNNTPTSFFEPDNGKNQSLTFVRPLQDDENLKEQKLAKALDKQFLTAETQGKQGESISREAGNNQPVVIKPIPEELLGDYKPGKEEVDPPGEPVSFPQPNLEEAVDLTNLAAVGDDTSQGLLAIAHHQIEGEETPLENFLNLVFQILSNWSSGED